MNRNLFLPTLLIICMAFSNCTKLSSISTYGMEWQLGALFQSYHNIYFDLPQDADDIIDYVLLIEKEEGPLTEANVFYYPYKFLKRYRDEILIFADNEYIYMYFKNRKPKNLMATTEYYLFCQREKGLGGYIRFFDNHGTPIIGEALSERYNKELKRELFDSAFYKLPNVQWQREEGRDFPDVIIIEFTPEQGLINLCSKTEIDISTNHYYKQLYDCLKEFSEDNSLSKIILDSYIPAE